MKRCKVRSISKLDHIFVTSKSLCLLLNFYGTRYRVLFNNRNEVLDISEIKLIDNQVVKVNKFTLSKAGAPISLQTLEVLTFSEKFISKPGGYCAKS